MDKGSILGKIFFASGIIILTVLFSWEAFADAANVVNIRRNIPLSDEAAVYKDFYINAGSDLGLKKNMVVSVIRKLGIRDATGTQNYGEIPTQVGQLKIISVQNKVAIAREYLLTSRDSEPMIEQIGIMTGDEITLEGSFIDNKKASAR